MRICLISNEYPPETGFGGIGTYTYNLAQSLSKKGHDITVITKALRKDSVYKDRNVKVYRILDKKLPFKGITRIFNLFSGGGFSRYWHSRFVFLKIREVMKKEGKFDVIEGPLWDGECICYSNKLGAPLVLRLQTPIFKSTEILGKNKNRFLEFIERKSLEKATLITSISKNISEVISRYYKIPSGKILLCYLGIQFPDIAKPVFKKDPFKLLYVGRLEKRKGTEEFIDSLPEILEKKPKILVDIVGRDCYQTRGNISYAEYFKIKVPKKFSKRVKFHGFVSKSKLDNFYQNCDVFIAPSRYESFGLIFLEAMSYGKPVIGTKVGGIPEIVRDKEVGLLIDVNKPDQIAGSVIKLFDDEKLREKLGRRAFSYVRKNFSVEKLTETSLRIYNQAIKKFYE